MLSTEKCEDSSSAEDVHESDFEEKHKRRGDVEEMQQRFAEFDRKDRAGGYAD